MLSNHDFIVDLHLPLWQEQEKSTKQVQERLITELVKKLLLCLVWKPLTELAALGTGLLANRRLRQFCGKEDVLCRAGNAALQ